MERLDHIQWPENTDQLQWWEKIAYMLSQLATTIWSISTDHLPPRYQLQLTGLQQLADDKPFLSYLTSSFCDETDAKHQLLDTLDNDPENHNKLLVLMQSVKELPASFNNVAWNWSFDYFNSLLSWLKEVTNTLDKHYKITLFRRLAWYKNVSVYHYATNYVAQILLHDLNQLAEADLPIWKKLASLVGVYPEDIFSSTQISQSAFTTPVNQDEFEKILQTICAQLYLEDRRENTVYHILHQLSHWLEKNRLK
jgi:hypothetical protein